MKRVFVDLKENHKGVITGTVKLPADSVFVFETLAEVLAVFARSCEVDPVEIAADLYRYLKKEQESLFQDVKAFQLSDAIAIKEAQGENFPSHRKQ